MLNTNFTACQDSYYRQLPHDYNDIDTDLYVDALTPDDVELTAITSPDFIAAHPELANGFAEFAIEAENEGEVEL